MTDPIPGEPSDVPPPPPPPPPPGPGQGVPPPPPGAAPPGYAPPGYGAEPPLSPTDERMWAMLAHLSIFVLSLIGPILILVLLGKRSRFVEDQSKEALNFHLSVLIASVVSVLLCFVVIGFVLLPIVVVGSMVLGIVAAIRSYGGEAYRYPVTLRLVR